MNTRISCWLCRGWFPVAIATAVSLAATPVSAGKPPPPPPPPPPVTFTAVDIGNLAGAIGGGIEAINEAGTIVGTAELPSAVTTAFVIEPLPGTPNPIYSLDATGDGINDLIKVLQRLSSSEEFGSGNYATDINASGVIVGWQWGIGPVLWIKSDGAYGAPVALFDPSWVDRWDLGNYANINDSGVVVGSVYKPTGEGVPYIIVPKDVNGDGKPDTWFEDLNPADGINDLLLVLPFSQPIPGGDTVDVTNDGNVIMSGTAGIIRPDFADPDADGNPWYDDSLAEGYNSLAVPVTVNGYVLGASPNGRLAAGESWAGDAASLIDLTAHAPTSTSLGVPTRADGSRAWGVNDAEWVVGASFIVERRWTPRPGTHLGYVRIYTGLLWVDRKMWDFDSLLADTAVSAVLPGVINNSGIVAGTATSASGQPTMFVAFPSVPPVIP